MPQDKLLMDRPMRTELVDHIGANQGQFQLDWFNAASEAINSWACTHLTPAVEVAAMTSSGHMTPSATSPINSA